MSKRVLELAPVFSTETFERDWRQAGNSVRDLRLLKTLLQISTPYGVCVQRFQFVEHGLESGFWYCRVPDLARGVALYAYYGVTPTYLIGYYDHETEVVAEMRNPVSRVYFTSIAEQIFNEWTRVR